MEWSWIVVILIWLHSIISGANTSVCFNDDNNVSVYSVKHCPDGWVRYEDTKCFKYFKMNLTQGRAEEDCQLQDSTLASIANKGEHQFLNSYIIRKVKIQNLMHVWLGGEKKDSLWFWTDLTPFSSYTDWWPGHPDFNQGYSVVLINGGNYFKTHPTLWGKMGTVSSANNLPYICQKYQKDSKAVRLVKRSNL